MRLMKMLIAEDESISRTMLQAILSEWGFEVVSVADGDEAWTVMQEADAPQLAVLDWVMPGRNGLTLCRELRELKRQDPLYIILLTSKRERGDIVRGLDAGADDYIAKPYDSEELRARVSVGRRLLELQTELRKREKLQGVVEMAGAVCHELNQPLQYVSGFSELMLMDMSADDTRCEMLKNIKEGIDRISMLTRKIMGITKYRSKDYMDGDAKIIDIESASVTDF
jgi:phosphoserine phosphatase RsbU/P